MAWPMPRFCGVGLEGLGGGRGEGYGACDDGDDGAAHCGFGKLGSGRLKVKKRIWRW